MKNVSFPFPPQPWCARLPDADHWLCGAGQRGPEGGGFLSPDAGGKPFSSENDGLSASPLGEETGLVITRLPSISLEAGLLTVFPH